MKIRFRVTSKTEKYEVDGHRRHEWRCQMCSTSGPVLAEIDPEGIGFKKYKCRNCGRSLKASGRYPTCPDCGSEDLKQS